MMTAMVFMVEHIHRDLREAGNYCGVKRVARLMQQAKVRYVRGYRQPRYKADKPGIASLNRLHQQFTVNQPDVAWVTYIKYIRTYKGPKCLHRRIYALKRII